jgi:cell division protein FtsN
VKPGAVKPVRVKQVVFLLILLSAAAPAADAQDSTAAVDTVLQRAEAMVDAGRAAAGRALVDSALAIRTPGTEAYAEALYARASLAATADDAERDYLRLTVEYTLSPRSSDALLRLAQLELARGDRTQATAHLTRLTEDHPAALNSPRTNLSVARAYQELGDQPHACAALAAAQHAVSQSDIELHNQIDYAARPCPSAATAPPAAAPPAVAATPVADTTTKVVPVTPPPAHSTPPAAKPVVAAAPPTPAPAAPRPAPPSVVSASAKGAYTIQVAAYNTQAPATALAAKLTARGVPARVSGTASPFRVRIGRYPTHAAAESAAADLKSKQITGFITDAEPAGR